MCSSATIFRLNDLAIQVIQIILHSLICSENIMAIYKIIFLHVSFSASIPLLLLAFEFRLRRFHASFIQTLFFKYQSLHLYSIFYFLQNFHCSLLLFNCNKYIVSTTLKNVFSFTMCIFASSLHLFASFFLYLFRSFYKRLTCKFVII